MNVKVTHASLAGAVQMTLTHTLVDVLLGILAVIVRQVRIGNF